MKVLITVADQPFLLDAPDGYDDARWNIYGSGFVEKFLDCYEKHVAFLEGRKAKTGINGIVTSDDLIDEFLHGEVWASVQSEVLESISKQFNRTSRDEFFAGCFLDKFKELARDNNVDDTFPPTTPQGKELVHEAASETAFDLIFDDGTAYMDFFEFTKCVCERYKLMLYNIYEDEMYMDPQVHILYDHESTTTFTVDVPGTDEIVQIESSNYYGSRQMIKHRLNVETLDEEIIVFGSACDDHLFTINTADHSLSFHSLISY